MHYSVSWSGGKDSTASIILAHLNNEPIDSIVFVEVMYDNERGISGECPQHIEFINKVAKPLFESWGYKVYILRSEKDYIGYFNTIVKRAVTKPQNIGKRRGFPIGHLCGIKRDCKIKPLNNFYKSINDKIVKYIGIAIDEPSRLVSVHNKDDQLSLLEKYGYTEEMAYKLCEEYGLLSPMYKYSKRGGCWFCPNAKIEEQVLFAKTYPDVWEEFVKLEEEKDLANDGWDDWRKKKLIDIDKKVQEKVKYDS